MAGFGEVPKMFKSRVKPLTVNHLNDIVLIAQSLLQKHHQIPHIEKRMDHHFCAEKLSWSSEVARWDAQSKEVMYLLVP